MKLLVLLIFEEVVDRLYEVSSVLFLVSTCPLDNVVILLKVGIHCGVFLEVMEFLFDLCEFSFKTFNFPVPDHYFLCIVPVLNLKAFLQAICKPLDKIR